MVAACGDADEAVPVRVRERGARLGVDGALEFVEAFVEAAFGTLADGDGAIAFGHGAEFIGADVVGGVAGDGPSVVADEAGDDAVEVAAVCDLAVLERERAGVGDAVAAGDEFGAQVVLLGVVGEGGVVAADGEEGVAADGGAAANDDFGETAGLAGAIGQEDFAAECGEVGGRGVEGGGEVARGWRGVVVEHDEPVAGGVVRGGVACGGGGVVVEPDDVDADATGKRARGADGLVGGVVGDDEFGFVAEGARIERAEDGEGVREFGVAVVRRDDEGEPHQETRRTRGVL